MREKQVCRYCFESGRVSTSGRKPFASHGAKPHYAPDLPFKLEHIFLDVTVDPKAKTLRGTVTQKIKVVAPDQKIVRLDQIGIQVEKVQWNDQPTDFTVEGNSLFIHLKTSPKVGEEISFSIQYGVEKTKRGLYFTGPDEFYPKKPFQVWSQGQDEDNRNWFPTFDYPNQKATSEIRVVVPKGFTAISNGALLSKTEVKDGTQFHYKIGVPHVTYLITLTVGEFAAWEDAGPRGLPVQYFVAPGSEANGKRAFGNTPKMIEAFEKKTGVAYPYEKYSQVAVQDFIFGGMENTSATTQTDHCLFDERASLDFSSDPLVSHELAHQWFGDLLTCRDWSHGWLNEGFATFMERVWIEENPGPHGGIEEAKYYSYLDLKDHLEEDQEKYRRPIVCNTYLEPIDLFDTHLYQKGGLVLNLLRAELGEANFWKSIHHYVTTHRGKSVETIDLIRAIEDVTGKNLRRFFDEWIFGSGYPEFEISYQWHEEKKLAELTVEQKQTGGKPELTEEGSTTPIFHLVGTFDFVGEDGKIHTHTVNLAEARERIFIPVPTRPKRVRFDRGGVIPKTLKFPRPKELLLYQLENDTDCLGRIEAAIELGKVSDLEITKALGKSLIHDSFWAVQAEVAEVLASIRSDTARDALLAGITVKNPKARRAVVKALGTFKTESVAQALKKIALKDESYFVEAQAMQAYAASALKKTPELLASQTEEIENLLLSQLDKPSYREIIRATALKSLPLLPGIGRGERPRALQALIDWTRRGVIQDARDAAVMGLGEVLKVAEGTEKKRILGVFSNLVDEDNFKLKVNLVHALRHSELSETIPLLQRIGLLELDGRVRRGALSALDEIVLGQTKPETVTQLKASLDMLEEEYRKLRSLVEESKAGIVGEKSK